ncbi:MAG: hypothetical protein ACQUHE_06645 [Bacteroidia bacterium]
MEKPRKNNKVPFNSTPTKISVDEPTSAPLKDEIPKGVKVIILNEQIENINRINRASLLHRYIENDISISEQADNGIKKILAEFNLKDRKILLEELRSMEILIYS